MTEALTVICLTTVRRRLAAERAVAMFIDHHLEANARLIVVDDPVGPDGVVFIERALPEREFARLALVHTAATLVAAVRPSVVRAVASQNRGVVIVLPDDAETFARIDALVRPDGAVVLLNTRFAPPPLDGKLPDAVDTAKLGRIDPDLFALRADDERALEFLASWVGCLVRSPHIGTERLDPTVFPWFDSLADHPGVVCVTDPFVPVSVRNADEPQRAGPAALVRWPGFDATTPWILSAETGELPRVRPTTHPQLARLANNRARALADAAVSNEDEPLVAFSHLPNGLAVTGVIRHAYTAGLKRFESGNADEPPNPFAGDPTEDFIAWLVSPVKVGEAPPFVTSFRTLHPELGASLSSDADVVAWLNDRGSDTGVPRELRPHRTRLQSPADPVLNSVAGPVNPAIEVNGYIDAAFGMGVAARVLLAACEESTIPTSVVVDTRTAHHQQAAIQPWRSAEPLPPVVAPVLVLVRNADALLADPSDAVAARAAGRKVVALWFWEVATFPERLKEAFALVDEIWVATEFVAESIRAHNDSPSVYLLPFPLPEPLPSEVVDRLARSFAASRDIADGRLVVAFSFDYDSVADRKNPWGAVEAYRLAFPIADAPLPDGRIPLLVLKAIGAERHPIDQDRLRHSIGDRPDILLIEEHLDADRHTGLFARADVYLSLHRGEGLGLTVAEAMAVGTPVVVTDYGGTTSFCDTETAWLVPYTATEIPLSTPVYAGCGLWAEPDVFTAANYLRAIATTAEPAATISRHATEQLSALFVTRRDAARTFVKERVHALLGITATHTNEPTSETFVPTLEPVRPSGPEMPDPTVTVNTVPAGLGPVVLPGASPSPASTGGGILSPVADRVRSTVAPMIATQAAFEQGRVVALVEAMQQTRQAVLDLETNARAERQTLTEVIGGVQAHVSNVQANHDALYATVTELSTATRESTMGRVDLHLAVARIDARLDDITRQLHAILKRLD